MTKFTSLEKYFSLNFLMLVAYIFATISIIIYAKKDYNNFIERKQKALESTSYKIAFDLANIFDNIEITFGEIGKKIVRSDESKIAIGKVLIDSELARLDDSVEKQLSSGKFYWIDAQNRLSVNSNGVIENPITLSDRDYLQHTSRIFGRIFGGEPIVGAVSGQYIIPVGYGILGKKGEYIGSLAVGLRLSELNARLSALIDGSKVNFAIFDEHNDLLLASDENMFKNDKEFLDELAKGEIVTNKKFMSETALFKHKNSYMILRGIEKYPYKIAVIYPNKMLISELALEMLPLLIQFLFMTVFYYALRFR